MGDCAKEVDVVAVGVVEPEQEAEGSNTAAEFDCFVKRSSQNATGHQYG